MMRDNICVFFQHMPPYPGAASLRGISIVNHLERLSQNGGTKVKVFATEGLPQNKHSVSIEIIKNSKVANNVSLLKRLLGELSLGLKVGRRLTFHKSAFAIISSPAFLTALVASWWCRAKGIPYALEIRDVYPQVYASAGVLKTSSFIYRLLLIASQGMYKNSCSIVAATGGLVKSIKPLANNIPVSLVYNGFPEKFKKIRPTKHLKFTLCFHGVLGYFQDVETLIQLASKLEAHDIDLIVIGYGVKEVLFNDKNLPNNIEFLGRKSFDDTIIIVSRCHLGICLRRGDDISKNAFPVKVWEYLGLSIPSIVTPYCEAGEFLEQHNCGKQFEPGDFESISEFVLHLKKNPDLVKDMEMNCEVISSGYTREQMGKEAASLLISPFLGN